MTINAPVAASARASLTVTAGAWTPASITGLRAWYDASDAATITASAGKVSQWNNKAGGAHMVQGTGAKQPSTGVATINSLNVLSFGQASAETGMLAAGSVTVSALMGNPAGGTTLYVEQFLSTLGGGQAALPNWGTDGNGCTEKYGTGDIYQGWGRTTRPMIGNTTALNSPALVTITSGAAAWTYRINTSVFHTNATNTVAWQNSHAAWMFNNPGNGWADAKLGEVLVYDTVLSGADLTNAEAYLKTKWGTP